MGMGQRQQSVGQPCQGGTNGDTPIGRLENVSSSSAWLQLSIVDRRHHVGRVQEVAAPFESI